MKRKTMHPLSAVLAAALILGLAFGFGTVKPKADVIYEPVSSFYQQHRNECTIDNETYECNVENGIKVYESPESDTIVAEMDFGGLFGTACIYTAPDGTRWACGSVLNRPEYTEGWVPYDYLWKVYNSEMFEADYNDRILIMMDGVAELDRSFAGKEIYFYSYPGGPEEYHVTLPEEDEEYFPTFSRSFVDEEGRVWAYIGYYMGHADWCCADAPDLSFEELFPDGAPVRDKRERAILRITCEVEQNPLTPTTGDDSATASVAEQPSQTVNPEEPSDEEQGASLSETTVPEQAIGEAEIPEAEKKDEPNAPVPVPDEAPEAVAEDAVLTIGTIEAPLIEPAKKTFPWWIAGAVGGVAVISVFLVLLLKKKK